MLKLLAACFGAINATCVNTEWNCLSARTIAQRGQACGVVGRTPLASEENSGVVLITACNVLHDGEEVFDGR